MANVILDPGYAKDLRALESHERKGAEKSLERFSENPRHPGLHFEKMTAITGWHTYRVNDDIRVAVQSYPGGEDTWMLCRVGHHEMIDRVVTTAPIYDGGHHEIIYESS